MGLGSLGSLNVLLSADTAQFTSAMDKAAYSAEKSLRKIGFATKLGITAMATAFVANTKNALDFAETMGKMSQRLGITTEAMSKLAYAAKLSDISIETLETSFRKMYQNAYAGADAFAALGVSVKDSSGRLRNGADIFQELAEKFAKMPDSVGKASAAMQIFGKNGAEIIPLLNQGKDGLKAFADEAERLGVVVSDTTSKDAERFNDMLKKMGEAAKGVSMRFVDMVASVVKGFSIVFMSSNDYAKSIEDYKKSVDEAASSSEKQAKANMDAAESFELAAEAAEKHKKMMADGEKLTESLRTAQEKYNDEMEFYTTLLQGGAIGQETYQRAAKKSLDTLHEETKQTNKLKDAASDLGFSFQSAFEDAIIEGKKFSEVLVGLAKDIERIMLRKMITEPLANALSAGIGNFFSTPTKAVSVTTASKHGNIFSNGSLVPFATGGIIGGPTMFPMAGGKTGLAGEAGKEAILPLTRTTSGDLGVMTTGASRTIVNVYAPEGSKVSQDSQQNGNTEMINVYIDEAVAGNIGKPGSKTHRMLRNTFGVGQTLTKR
jgi:hypothetical protein